MDTEWISAQPNLIHCTQAGAIFSNTHLINTKPHNEIEHNNLQGSMDRVLHRQDMFWCAR